MNLAAPAKLRKPVGGAVGKPPLPQRQPEAGIPQCIGQIDNRHRQVALKPLVEGNPEISHAGGN
jgi:hypothetical protein